KYVLHEQQRDSKFCYTKRAFVMRYRHQEALTRCVMLGHASQTSGVMQNAHDKPGNLPDPDIFAIHSRPGLDILFAKARGKGPT
ncbi:unnamed protein product, partial [Amoebophrya sp. A120]